MIKKYIFDKMRNKEGAALITVLVIFLTLVVIVTSATAVAFANFQRSKKSADTSSVIYIAETGLNEYYDKFTKFYEKTKETVHKYHEDFAESFLLTIGNDVDHSFVTIDLENMILRTDYGKVMNQTAFSEFKVEFLPLESNEFESVYYLKSTGYIGDNNRTVSRKITIKEGIAGISYKPETSELIGNNPNDIINLPVNGKKLKGPLITNKILKTIAGIIEGPIVTNNTVNIVAPEWKNSVLITSNKINIDLVRAGNMGTIMLKSNGKINFTNGSTEQFPTKNDWDQKYSWQTTKSINDVLNVLKNSYIFLPRRINNDYSEFFQFNGENNTFLTDTVFAAADKGGNENVKIVLYEPKNFDPYTSNVIPPSTLSNEERIILFGEEPIESNQAINRIDFRTYFKEGFILDRNIDLEDLRPSLKMPTKPKSVDIYPHDNFANVEFIAGKNKNILVDNNNNLKFKMSYYYNDRSFNSIDFKSPTSKYNIPLGKDNARYFSSINIEGGDNANEPVIIDIGSSDIKLITDSLHISGHLKVKGTGTLHIYVIGDQNRNGGLIDESQFNIPIISLKIESHEDGKAIKDAGKVQFIVYETNKNGKPLLLVMPQQNHDKFYSVFSENLNFNVYESFRGNLASAKGDSFTIRSDSNDVSGRFFFAPEAIVKITDGKVRALIVAKNIEFSGSGEYEFSNIGMSDSSLDLIFQGIQIPGSDNVGIDSTITSKPIREED